MIKIAQINIIALGFTAGILVVISFGNGPSYAAAQSSATCTQWEVMTSRAAEGSQGAAVMMPIGYEPYGAQNGGNIVYLRRCAN